MEIIILLISLALVYWAVKKPSVNNAECVSLLKCGLGSVEPNSLESNIIPEDSVLKRHYLSHLYYQKLAITNPYPTDVVLRRHYETQVASLLPSPEKVAVQAPKKATRKPRTTTKAAVEPKKTSKSPKTPKSSVVSGSGKPKKK